MIINDAHCHFFSTPFFEALARQRAREPLQTVPALTRELGWDDPGEAGVLADRWVAELDRHGVGRAALIASVPGDESSVSAAVARHPGRFVGFFMVDPTAADAPARAAAAIDRGLRGVCLFPAMQRYHLHDERVQAVVAAAAARPGTAVFVHCGVLSVGVREKLGLPSRFDMRLGNPLDLHLLARGFPQVPFIVPHFGAGLFREVLMLGEVCPNVHVDTSSSNRWIRYTPGLTLAQVLATALDVFGKSRLLFGSDSSFFPRGWVAGVHEAQRAALMDLAVREEVRAQIFGENFDRLFPA